MHLNIAQKFGALDVSRILLGAGKPSIIRASAHDVLQRASSTSIVRSKLPKYPIDCLLNKKVFTAQ